jgi:cyclase
MITLIDNDGRQKGYDTDLVAAITNAVKIPVTASGGGGTSDDPIDLYRSEKCDVVATVSLLH